MLKIYPINILRALSMALELSTGGLSGHHWRTALIASRLGRFIEINDLEHTMLVYAALIHDVGAASSWTETKKLRNLAMNQNIYDHAKNGYLLLKESAQLSDIATIILHRHDFWDGANPSELKGKDIPLLSRIITLADRIEVMIDDKKDIFEQKQEIVATIQGLSGSYVDPDLVRALIELSKKDSFWMDLTNTYYYNNFFTSVDAQGMTSFSTEDVLALAHIFANVIDSMSSFTARHSKTVAKVAGKLAKMIGFSANEVTMMQIAGLFHDLGKLGVPNEILEKNGKLTPQEFSLIKYHPYYTYRILQEIDGFKEIAEWAAYHHETLDGTGYPFRIKADNLTLGSRVMAVADIFTALTEDRPYRKGLPFEKVMEIMDNMVIMNKIDKGIVELLHTSDEFRTLG